MTVEECANKIIDICLGPLAASGNPQDTEKGAIAMLAALNALIYAESERCAAALDNEAEECGEIQVAGLLRSCAEQILRTSPGKGDG